MYLVRFLSSFFVSILSFTVLFIAVPSAHAQNPVTPTVYCAGSNFCVPSATVTLPAAGNNTDGTADGTENPGVTTTITATTTPCEQTISAAHNNSQEKRHHKRHRGLMGFFWQFFLQILQRLLELLGAGGSLPNIPSQPSQPTQPAPTTGPQPTTPSNPCLTVAPTLQATTAPTTPPASPVSPTLGATKVFLGAAINPGRLDDAAYSGALKKYGFDSLTAENAMKFTNLEANQGQFNWGESDKMVAFAQANGMRVRGHTLVWGRNNVPGWLSGMSNEQAEAAVKNHIQTVVGRYKGKIAQWDVVNEAFNQDGSLDGGVFRQKLGDDFILKTFQWAHEADPTAVLFYNEFGAEGIADRGGNKKAKSDAVFELAKKLKAAGLPVGVGLQTHSAGDYPGTEAEIQANIKRLTDLGIVVEITELDVVNIADQAARYAEIGRACKAAGCSGITTWGLYDGQTWLSGKNPLLLDGNFNAKPTYEALIKAIGR